MYFTSYIFSDLVYIILIVFIAGNVTVNNAQIIESEVFVYNLGTMFYIDEILYPDLLKNLLRKSSTSTTSTTTITTSIRPSQTPSIFLYSTVADVEPVPSEITESNDGDDSRDVLLQDDDNQADEDEEDEEPRALPLLYIDSPK